MVNITRTLEQRSQDQMLCSRTHESRHVIYSKPPTNRIPLRSSGRNEVERTQSVQTQTPNNDLSYEFDRTFYTFKENVRRTVPVKQTSQQRKHLRVYQPTIIDTKPRGRRIRSKVDPTISRMLSCAHLAPSVSQSPRPACTCNHRAAARADNKQREDPDNNTNNKTKTAPRERTITPRDKQPRDQYDTSTHITPVLAVAIRRNPQDKDPIVQFNGVVGQETRLSFTPFVKHVSTQTFKSNVHVEFEIPDES